MLGSASIRRQNAQDFKNCYESACSVQSLAPVAAVRKGLSPGMLDLNGDAVCLPDWSAILSSLAINKELHHVGIKSCFLDSLGSQDLHNGFRRKKTPVIHSKNMTLQLCKTLQKCLCFSRNLKTLHLHGLPLRERDLDVLTKGLSKSVSLEHLSLARCPIADEGLETICQSVKYSTTIKTVDFTACNITWRGADHMANIIKHQAVKRHSSAWAETLRYRKAEFEAMGGLRRLTLNDNILIGDRGVTSLTQELVEDLWVKALDLQRCGISNEGAQGLETMLQSNSTLCVLDIRRNPLVDNELVKSVIKKVLMNAQGQDSLHYLWLQPPAKDAHENSRQMTRRNTGKATFRIGTRRASSAGWKPPRAGSAGYIPWRTTSRAKIQSGVSQGAESARQSFQNASSIRFILESESVSECEENESVPQAVCAQSPRENIASSQFRRLQDGYKHLQDELKECRLRLAEERNARLKASSRLLELELEINRLRSVNQSLAEVPVNRSVLEDEQVLDSIESSFQKFHAFLDLLKDAGLGQLASMAGIGQSDFGLLGHPQLSSTQRRGQEDQRSKQREDDAAITDHLQRLSRVQNSRSISASSAASKQSRNGLRSTNDVHLTPTVLLSTSSPPQDQPEVPEQQLRVSPTHSGSESGTDKGQSSRGSRSGSSASSVPISVRSKLSYSYRDDFIEERISSALSSRSSSTSQFNLARFNGTEGHRSAAGLAGF